MKDKVFVLRAFILLILLISINSCADKIKTLDNITAPQEKTTTDSQTAQLSKFSEIQDQVFTPTCALSGCHGDNFTQAKLNLTKGKAYSNLINVKSSLFTDMDRVVPGNAAQSLLYKAINHDPGVPLQMPQNGPKLDQKIIDSIAVWINKGAPND
jgi:hypothetical protein